MLDFQPKQNVATDCPKGKQLIPLQHVANGVLMHMYFSFGGFKQSRNQRKYGSFATPTWAKQCHKFAILHLEGKVFYRGRFLRFCVKNLLDVFQFQYFHFVPPKGLNFVCHLVIDDSIVWYVYTKFSCVFHDLLDAFKPIHACDWGCHPHVVCFVVLDGAC